MELLEQLTAALGDRYRVERELGHGGMAVVFLAEDLKHRRRVAHQGAQARAVGRPRQRAVPPRDRDRRRAPAPPHPPAVRLGTGRRPALLRDAVRRGRVAPAAARAGAAAPARRRAPDHPRGRQRPAVRPRARGGPSGHQAGEHHAVAAARPSSPTSASPAPFSAAGGTDQLTQTRDGGRHAAVHEPGAGRPVARWTVEATSTAWPAPCTRC